MRLASVLHPIALGDAPTIRRTVTLAIVVALHILVLVMLLRLAPPATEPPLDPPTPLVVQLLPEAPAPRAQPAPAERRAARAKAPEPAKPPSDPPPRPVTPPPPVPSAVWSQVVPLTREQFAAADISNVPRTQSGDQGAESGSASGSERGDTEGPGTGPNGETLYNAEWHRRPTRAELAFYLPKGGQQTGWGMIACQTVPGNRVEDCREIAQSPAGSGLAGAVRQAAWQFRVRPPRVGGRPLVGAWVRIRIEYTVNGPE